MDAAASVARPSTKKLQQVKSILHDRPTEVRQKPLVGLPKN
jgi:hypothetical protein